MDTKSKRPPLRRRCVATTAAKQAQPPTRCGLSREGSAWAAEPAHASAGRAAPRAPDAMAFIKQGRREFLRGVIRASFLAGLAVLGGFLFSRKRIVIRADEKCINGWICSACSAYSKCRLPPALSRRKALSGEALDREVLGRETTGRKVTGN